MVTFRVTPHPGEAQVLQGQSLSRTLYSVGVDQAGGETVPVFLGVAMDQSGSMSGSKLQAAKEALINLLRQVPPTDEVIVHVTLFSTTGHELMPAMSGRQVNAQMGEIIRRIQSISAGGATSLGSGLRVELRASSAYPQFERRVLMITDGRQEGAEPI